MVLELEGTSWSSILGPVGSRGRDHLIPELGTVGPKVRDQREITCLLSVRNSYKFDFGVKFR